MARDLIPPPSPAGRPPPDQPSEPAATRRLEEATGLTAQADPALRDPAPFRARFGFVFGALAGIAVCAAALGVVLIASRGEDGPRLAENWSTWEPSTTEMVAGAADIAAHVSFRYRLDDGNQLAQVGSSGLEYQGGALGVAVRPRGGDLRYLEGDGLLYRLEGAGANGSLPGKATEARGQLVRREALELALYSFRYLEDVTMVAVLLPPVPAAATGGATSAGTRAIFFRPGDLLSRLQVPLAATLPGEPPRPKALSKAEKERIDSLTLRNLFLATLQPLRGNQTYLVLQEPDTVS
jgi:hypothetical protein